jgi:hypothetical protein
MWSQVIFAQWEPLDPETICSNNGTSGSVPLLQKMRQAGRQTWTVPLGVIGTRSSWMYLFMVYLTTLSIAQTIQCRTIRRLMKLRIEKDVEGSGRDLIQCTIPQFAWKGWGKPGETSVRISGLRVEKWSAIPLRHATKISILKIHKHILY